MWLFVIVLMREEGMAVGEEGEKVARESNTNNIFVV
jgi:hypothetical protein